MDSLRDALLAKPDGEPVKLAVILHDLRWRVLLDGERLAAFADREHACDCALEVAQAARAESVVVDVLAQDRFGRIVQVAA